MVKINGGRTLGIRLLYRLVNDERAQVSGLSHPVVGFCLLALSDKWF